jgi:hypothetical protein
MQNHIILIWRGKKEESLSEKEDRMQKIKRVRAHRAKSSPHIIPVEDRGTEQESKTPKTKVPWLQTMLMSSSKSENFKRRKSSRSRVTDAMLQRVTDAEPMGDRHRRRLRVTDAG